MKVYLQSASVLLILGSIVTGVIYFFYQFPDRSQQPAAPAVTIRPVSDPSVLKPAQIVTPLLKPKKKEAQQKPITESSEPQQAEEELIEVELPGDNAAESIQETEEVESVQELPADGEWQNRGARLKQGRKLTQHATLLMQKGRYRDASIVLENAIKSFPSGTNDLSYGEALYKLGICLRRKGQPDQAIPVLRQALQFAYYRTRVLREVEAATMQLRSKTSQIR